MNVGIGRQSREGRLMGVCEDLTGAGAWLYTAAGQLGRYRDGHMDLWGPDVSSSRTCRALVADDSGLVWVGSDAKLTAYGPFRRSSAVGLPVVVRAERKSHGQAGLAAGKQTGRSLVFVRPPDSAMQGRERCAPVRLPVVHQRRRCRPRAKTAKAT